MKRAALLFSGILFSSITFCQQTAEGNFDEDRISPPVFQTGNTFCQDNEIESIEDYLCYHLKEAGIFSDFSYIGTEMVSFIVEADGSIKDIKILNGLGPNLDYGIISLLNTTHGQWVPARINCTPIAVEKEISLVFVPHSDYNLLEEVQKLQKKGNHYLFVEKKPQKALKFFNKACKLLPCQESLLSAHCMCNYTLGDLEAALKDCERILTTDKGKEKYGEMSSDELLSFLYKNTKWNVQ